MTTDNCVKWIKLLNERLSIKEDLCNFIKSTESNIYSFEDVECQSTDGDEICDIVVFDLLEETIGKYSEYKINSMEEFINNHVCSRIIFIFKDWNEERKFYWSIYEGLDARAKSKFINIYSQKESIYIDCDVVEIKVDDGGINYLEYNNNNLEGWIYNVSLYDLKKLYNVTGSRLFDHNVRYGLLDDKIGQLLKDIFKHYIWNNLKQILDNRYPDKLDIDDIEGVLLSENSFDKYLLAENFWFHHNGITVFCFENSFNIKGNVLNINSKKISVINGAQTLTNFFFAEEEIYRKVVRYFKDKENILANMLADCLKKIFVKMIIIMGKEEYIKSITVGLNTQIPVERIDILSNSDEIDDINKKLKRKIRILKKGESYNNGISLLDFIKIYLVIKNMPGKSKNFRKADADNYIGEINKADDFDDLAKKMSTIRFIYSWWDATKNDRYYVDMLYNDSNHIIARYGKNYFAMYVLQNVVKYNFSVEPDSLKFLYSSFVNLFCELGLEFELGTFKKDEAASTIVDNIKDWNTVIYLNDDIKKEIEKDIVGLKFENVEYVINHINKIICKNNNMMPNLHIVIKKGDSYYKRFYFSDKSFDEIVDNMPRDGKDSNYLEFTESEFLKELNENKVFIVIKMNTDNECTLVEFTEKKISDNQLLLEEAKEFYENIIEIFKSGNRSKLEIDSTINEFNLVNREFSNEMIEFSDGEYIFNKKIAMDFKKII